MPASQKSSAQKTETLVSILKSQVIPCWERYGTGRVVVTAPTLKQFQAQPLSPAIQTSVKRRIGKKISARSRRVFNNKGTFTEQWPDDDQAVFRFPAMAFVLSGEAKFHVADYLIHCPTWHFLLFATGVPRPVGEHYLHFNLGQPRCDVLWLFAPPGTGGVVAYVCHCHAKRHWHDEYSVVYKPEAVQLFNFLMSELEEQSALRHEIVQPGLQAFLQLFRAEIEEERYYQVGKSAAEQIDGSIAAPIEQARQYIKMHLNKPLTAAEMAMRVYMSRTLFLQRFSQETGETFHAYVTRERMEVAGKLLDKGYWSTTQICISIGLRPTQFRAQFKRHFGVTPTEYRQGEGKRTKPLPNERSRR